MGVPVPRARRTMLAVAVPVGLVLSAALTWSSTYAAFSASAGNTGNTWQTGTVVLADNDSGAALFASADNGALKPGSTRSRCIRIDYSGDLQADVRMYVTTPTAGAATLDPYLVMSVERGADVSAGTTVAADCTTGFTQNATRTFLFNTHQADDPLADQSMTMARLKSEKGTYATGLVVDGTTDQGTSLTLKITYVVRDVNDAQNTTSEATFTWEARNT